MLGDKELEIMVQKRPSVRHGTVAILSSSHGTAATPSVRHGTAAMQNAFCSSSCLKTSVMVCFIIQKKFSAFLTKFASPQYPAGSKKATSV